MEVTHATFGISAERPLVGPVLPKLYRLEPLPQLQVIFRGLLGVHPSQLGGPPFKWTRSCSLTCEVGYAFPASLVSFFTYVRGWCLSCRPWIPWARGTAACQLQEGGICKALTVSSASSCQVNDCSCNPSLMDTIALPRPSNVLASSLLSLPSRSRLFGLVWSTHLLHVVAAGKFCCAGGWHIVHEAARFASFFINFVVWHPRSRIWLCLSVVHDWCAVRAHFIWSLPCWGPLLSSRNLT